MSSIGFEHTDENFAKLRASGLEAVEVALSSKVDLDIKGFAELAKRHDVTLWSCHLPYFPWDVYDISIEDAATRAKIINKFSEFIKNLSNYGVDKFVVHPSLPIQEGSDRNERKKCAMDSFAKLAEIAASCGAVIAAEDMITSCLGNSAEELLEIIGVDDRIRVCFDVNHLFNNTHADFLKKVGDKIVTLHISDYDFVEERHYFPGNGDINWPELYSAIRESGYNGVWMYETGLSSRLPDGSRIPLTFEDFYENATTIFAGKNPKRWF